MLTVNQQLIELGRVQFGKPKSFTYTLTNTSNKPVTVTKLAVGCTSCTKAHMKKSTVPAGGEGIIEVTFTPGSLGPQVKGLGVIYEGGVLNLKFKAESYA